MAMRNQKMWMIVGALALLAVVVALIGPPVWAWIKALRGLVDGHPWYTAGIAFGLGYMLRANLPTARKLRKAARQGGNAYREIKRRLGL